MSNDDERQIPLNLYPKPPCVHLRGDTPAGVCKDCGGLVACTRVWVSSADYATYYCEDCADARNEADGW